MTTRSPRASLFALYEATDLVEAAYAETEGEVTDDTEALEGLKALALDDALERFASFVRYCELGQENAKSEMERLIRIDERIERAKTWAQGQLLTLLEGAGKKKATAGTFRISTTIGRERVAVAKGFDLAATAPGIDLAGTEVPWTVITPEVTVEASARLDKKGALAHMKAGKEIHGLSIERGPTKVNVK